MNFCFAISIWFYMMSAGSFVRIPTASVPEGRLIGLWLLFGIGGTLFAFVGDFNSRR